MKLLIWLAIIMIVVWAWRSNKRRTGKSAAEQAGANAAQGEAMVSCAHCGVYLPASEALAQGDKQFCSAQHRQLHFSS